MKHRFKRILALAIALILTVPTFVFAEETEGIPPQADNPSEKADEIPEAAFAEDIVEDEEEELNEIQKPFFSEQDGGSEALMDEGSGSGEADNEDEEVPLAAFDESLSVNGVRVTVRAKPGVFPANAALSVKRLPTEDTIGDVRGEDQNVAVSYTFDIKVKDSLTDEEYQPADGQSACVLFSLAEMADENLTASVYHIDSSGSAKKLNMTREDANTAAVETDGFSVYTVEFTYNDLEYVLPGSASVPLSEILSALDLSGEVTEVKTSDASLFFASNEAGVWMITARQAFFDTEWLKVTIHGVTYEITVTDDSETDVSNAEKPDYSVCFDANVPANASVVVSGTMEDQPFAYGETKALSKNGYFLPGYEFNGWNTKADGTGTAYADKAEVQNLSENGGTVTLYAQWRGKPYTIEYWSDDAGSQKHVQTAYFDRPGRFDRYSDRAFGWNSGGKALHGWGGRGSGSFYGDGADFCNLCGTPDANGNVSDPVLIADWVSNGQIIVTVTKDSVPQEGLADCLELAQGSAIFAVPVEYTNGKYVFDPSSIPGPGGQTSALPAGEYDLLFSEFGYPPNSARITYGEDHAVSVTFDYCTVSLQKDPVFSDANEVEIEGGVPVSGMDNTVTVRDGDMLSIKTTVAQGYRFAGYTAVGVAPLWEGNDPSKAQQAIEIQGTAVITAHIEPVRYSVSVDGGTADRNSALPGETVTITADAPEAGKAFVQWAHADGVDYDNASSVSTSFRMPAMDVTVSAVYAPIVIAPISDKVYSASPIEPFDEVKVSLQGVDLLLRPEDFEVSFQDNVNAGKAAVTVTMKSPRAGSASTTFTIKKTALSVKANDQEYPYNGQIQGEGDTVYEDPAEIAEKITVTGLKGSDAITSIILDGQRKDIGKTDLVPSSAAIGEATANYDISYINGTLTIIQAVLNITVSGGSGQTVYNGEEQSFEAAVTAECSDAGFDASKFSYSGSRTVSGTEAGDYTAALSADNCSYSDKKYDVVWTISDPVKLTIDRRKVSVSAEDKTTEYNGSEQTGNTAYRFANVIESHKASITYTPAYGTLPNTYEGSFGDDFKVLAGEEDLTANYELSTKTAGKLTIRDRTDPYEITVTANSNTGNVYDGTEKSAQGFVTDTFTVEGHDYTVSGLTSSDPASTDVCDLANTVSGKAVVKDADGNDVTNQFRVRTLNGKLQITAKPVTVTASDQTIKEDESIHTGTDYTSLSDAVSGHVLSGITLTAENGEIVPSDAKIRNGEADVTSNYRISYQPGTLTVLRKIEAPVTFRVINGFWDDGTSADQTVVLKGYEGDILKLSKEQIPAVGNKPGDKTFKAGNWDKTPDTETKITEATVYTYTYAKKEPSSVAKAPTAKNLTYCKEAQKLVTAGEAEGGKMQYALGTDSAAPASGWNKSVPSAASAGNYYVWYMVKGDQDHLDTDPVCIPVTIAKTPVIAVEGDGAAWTKGSSKGPSVTFKTSLSPDLCSQDTFRGIRMDEQDVNEGNYTVQYGSVIITLKPSYLNKLSAGRHTITAVFDENMEEGTASLTIKDYPSSGEKESEKKSDGVITCQMAGYPADYAWNEAAKACQPGFLDSNGVFHAKYREGVPNTYDAYPGKSIAVMILSTVIAVIAGTILLKMR